uniref:Macro domain-containing protein n=1 Tax=Compsopogon caeruleus TaxID=31354 RepID=A0A7S1T8A5_9RHOD|mmetsp:Transcript_12413/g.25269  ORF Transcript_12413/g.25269 Transcript_12413/m.25269 type:complete len:194 (+) Transcript_12413:106-687(+)
MPPLGLGRVRCFGWIGIRCKLCSTVAMASRCIRYLVGDATRPQKISSRHVEHENQIIVHVCNDIGGWGAGFVVALSRRWRQPELEYRAWYEQRANNDFSLGAVQLVAVEQHLWVANLVGQRDVKMRGEVPPIRYDAVQRGLHRVAEAAKERNATVHMPRIGCGLAGGSWDSIEPLILQELVQEGVDVTVYDLP